MVVRGRVVRARSRRAPRRHEGRIRGQRGRDQDGERETEIGVIVIVIVIVIVVQSSSNASNGPSGRVTLVTPASVKGEAAGARAQVVACDGSTIDAGVVVIAAGAHSAGLARQCGDPVPLDTERGYHVQWNEGAGDKSDGAPMLTRPVCTPEGGSS